MVRVKNLLGILIGICRRRLGPQDLPHSPALLRGLLLVAIGLELLVSMLVRERFDSPGRLLFSLLLTLGLPWLLLTWRQRQARYVQTVSALIGTGILLSLLLAPLIWFARDLPMPAEGVPPAPGQVLVSLLALAVVAWKVAIDGHIWRHALDWPVVGGVLLALSLLFLEIGLDQMLFAAPAPPAP